MDRRALIVVLGVLAALFAIAGAMSLDYAKRVAAGVAYLPSRSFGSLTAVAVGTGGSYENPRRLGPCTAVGLGSQVLLVGAGRGVAEGLRAAEIPVRQPAAVYLTSLLPEDTVGLDDLLLTGWLAPRSEPLRLVGPAGTRALAEGLLAAHARGARAQEDALSLPGDGARFSVTEVGDGFEETAGGIRVRAAALPDASSSSLAWRFEAGGRSVVIAGSGFSPDAVVELARGADLLVHEAVFRASIEQAIASGADDPERLRREAGLHPGLREAGRVAERAGVRRLALVRLRPPPLLDFQFTRVAGEAFDGDVVIPEDGEQLLP